jgi:replicative DNA helicase
MINIIERDIIAVLLCYPQNYQLISNYFDIFSSDESKTIIRIINNVVKKAPKFDMNVIVSHMIENEYNISISYISEIAGYGITDANLKYHIGELCKVAMKKKLENYCRLELKDNGSIDEIKRNVTKIFDEIKSVDEISIEDGKKEYIKMIADIEGNIIEKKVFSGYTHIEDSNDGYDLTDYIIIGGAESVGKTSFMLHLISRQLMQGLRIALFECEMSREKIYYLLACMVAGVNPKFVQKGLIDKQQKYALSKSLEMLYEKPFYVYNSRDWQEIKNKTYIMKSKYKVDMIYHDYLQYLRLNGVNDQYQRLECISAETKALSVELKTPICQLSSLNRTGKVDEPENYHIKGNGDIEYNADIILLLWTISNNISGDYGRRSIGIKVGKNRNGELNKESYTFSPALKRFEKEYE